MKLLLMEFLLATILVAPLSALAASGPLKKGDTAGVFYVTKIAGAKDDGVQTGQELCYRCRYGSRPIVMVFTRESTKQVQQLVKTIDKAVDKNQEAHLKGLVTFMGDDIAEVKENASEFAKNADAKHVPVVIAKETDTGPANYKLDESEVTVVVAKDSQVVATHRFEADKINIAAVMTEVKQILH